jgi:hypothetical protein
MGYGQRRVGWVAQCREGYVNDQGQEASLVAVTARSNRSKADQDPAQWLSPGADVHCHYVGEWVATQLRWNLTVDETELAASSDGHADGRTCSSLTAATTTTSTGGCCGNAVSGP